jgi:phage tail tape-measure protein
MANERLSFIQEGESQFGTPNSLQTSALQQNPFTGFGGVSDLDILQTGASNQAGIVEGTFSDPEFSRTKRLLPIGQAPETTSDLPEDDSINLKNELAQIQAMRRGSGSGGLGKTIGGTAGGAIGSIWGPAGTVVGSAVGGTAGSLVDYMIDKDADDKADIIRTSALKKEKIRLATKQNTDDYLQGVINAKQRAISSTEAGLTKSQLVKQMRSNLMKELINNIGDVKKNKRAKQQQFIQSRSLV